MPRVLSLLVAFFLSLCQVEVILATSESAFMKAILLSFHSW